MGSRDRATAGLGLAVAESLAGAGANIVLHDLIEPTETRIVFGRAFAVEVTSIEADVAARVHRNDDGNCSAALRQSISWSTTRWSGTLRRSKRRAGTWDEALAVDLSAPFHLIRLVLPAMKKRGWGRIFNIASIYSTRAVADRIDYVTTKTAILGMTRAVAIETAMSGITCNALCPGTLPTPAITQKIASIAAASGRSIDKTTRDYLAARQPTGRFIAMEAVGAMVVSCQARPQRTSRARRCRSMEAGPSMSANLSIRSGESNG